MMHEQLAPPVNIQEAPSNGGSDSDLKDGHGFFQQGMFAEAHACYAAALARNPKNAVIHYYLGRITEMGGEPVAAMTHYRTALEIDPGLRTARRQLILLLLQRQSRNEEGITLLHQELLDGGFSWFTDVILAAFKVGNLMDAGNYNDALTSLRWGSLWYPPLKRATNSLIPETIPNTWLTIPKLRHDSEQYGYLQKAGVLSEEFTPIIEYYELLIQRITTLGNEARLQPDDEIRQRIAHVYNRIVHVRSAPRVDRALSDTWDGEAVQSAYIHNEPGLVVIDKFLSSEALESLYLFCLESTIWSSNRHPHGRLGAQFQNGFNCPLLVQIAEELRERLPRLTTGVSPLRHMWAYKSGRTLPADSTTHADFAAINVNFWITPEVANLDKDTGGMMIYGVDAPPNWDHEMYNCRVADIIMPFLQAQGARAVTIPYRQNRAIIFNSDLFHATCKVNFRPEYEYRRINVTFLYGDRQHDIYHGASRHPNSAIPKDGFRGAWRSAAFSGSQSKKQRSG